MNVPHTFFTARRVFSAYSAHSAVYAVCPSVCHKPVFGITTAKHVTTQTMSHGIAQKLKFLLTQLSFIESSSGILITHQVFVTQRILCRLSSFR